MNSSNQTCFNNGKSNFRIVIYQLIPRLFTNNNDRCIPNGTINENGCGKLKDITARVLGSIKDLGITHVWYTGVIEHAHKTDYSQYGIAPDNPHIVKGNAGSPYTIKDYYDIDPDIAVDVPNRMREFCNLVRRTHRAGLKVILDFVPNHVARQYHSDSKPEGVIDLGANDDTNLAYSPNNNFYYLPGQPFSPSIDLGNGAGAYSEYPAKATGNDCFMPNPSAYDWYETVKLNYGVDYLNYYSRFNPIPDTWHKMLHILLFWAEKGVDGFRCDMAHMVPVPFWNWAIAQVKTKYPHVIFIAELYDVNIYRQYIYDAGFDYLYDKVNLYDTLRNIQCHGVSAASLTSCWQRIDGIGSHMLNFLENHDEQRIASSQYLGNAMHAIPAAIVSATINSGPFMLYAGQELGEPAADAEGYSSHDGRTTIFDYWSVPTIRRWYNHGKCDNYKLTEEEIQLRDFYSSLLNALNKYPALAHGGFYDLMYVNYDNPRFNPQRQFAYFRHCEGETILIVTNFDNKDVTVDINIPEHALSHIGIAEREYIYEDILTGEKGSIMISPDAPASISVKANNGVMLRLT